MSECTRCYNLESRIDHLQTEMDTLSQEMSRVERERNQLASEARRYRMAFASIEARAAKDAHGPIVGGTFSDGFRAAMLEVARMTNQTPTS